MDSEAAFKRRLHEEFQQVQERLMIEFKAQISKQHPPAPSPTSIMKPIAKHDTESTQVRLAEAFQEIKTLKLEMQKKQSQIEQLKSHSSISKNQHELEIHSANIEIRKLKEARNLALQEVEDYKIKYEQLKASCDSRISQVEHANSSDSAMNRMLKSLEMEVAELKRVRDLTKPLLDVGIAVRHRFLATFHQNIILEPGCPRNTINFPAISDGNTAANCGNALADAALILFDNVGCIDSNTKIFLTPLIRDLYRFPVGELHALHETKRRVLDCIATIFSLVPDFKKVLNSNIVYKETRDQWMNLDEVLWRMASRASEKVWDKPHTEGMVVNFERLTKDIVAIHKPQEIPPSDNIWCNARDKSIWCDTRGEKMKTAIDAIKNDRDWVYQGFKTISQLEEW